MTRALTTEEKARLFAGKDNWTTMDYSAAGLPSIRMSDGPHGLRIEKAEGLGFNASHPATLYPTASLTACSFDRDLQYELGTHLAQECNEAGVDILLGPGANHKRSPLCGRSFEYYSEDPYLSGELAASYINGVQDHGIGVSLKHFAGNSREFGRMVEDSVIDERALHEIYLAQFETAVRKSRPWTIMCAYNRLNGVYCCENKKLLDEARAWGFDGAFISDWGAVADPAASVKNGLNLEMPGGEHYSDRRILKALRDGTLSSEKLDESTEHLRDLVNRTRLPHAEAACGDHVAFAQRAAEESAVLLRNQGALPLEKDDTIALIGPFAREPRIQGTGSSKVNASEIDCLYDAMKEERVLFSWAKGFTLSPETVDEELEEQALSLAERCSKVIVVAGLPEGDEAEGYDRRHMSLPANQNHLIRVLRRVCRNVIVILQCGAPVELPWREEVNAILCMYLSGCRGGHAAMNLLSGKVNPSGRLAETWPVQLSDTPCYETFADHLLQVQYRESIFTGYRWYDSVHVPVAYPFGAGLSYTTFEYRDLYVSLENDQVHVSVRVRNSGTCTGKEVVQLYIGMNHSAIGRAEKELKGFEKVALEPEEEAVVSFVLDDRSFAYYDTRTERFEVETGSYRILVGSSSQDIRLEATVFRTGNSQPFSSIPRDYAQNARDSHGFSQAAFEAVLGRSLPAIRSGRPFTINSSIYELQDHGMGKLVKKGIDFVRSKKEFPGVTDEMIMEVPIRMALMASRRVTWDTVDAIRDMFNGKNTFLGVLATLRKKK